MRDARTYRSWAAMKTRCLSPTHERYSSYGGRGITVCERWLKYENFLADMGKRPVGQFSIDRIDNNGDYEPDNCRWATPKQQQSNTRVTSRAEEAVTRSLILDGWRRFPHLCPES